VDKADHYEATARYMRDSASQRDGFYDANSGGATRHTVWQRRIRSMALRQMARVIRQDPAIASAVDIGCGRGDFTVEIADRFPCLEKVVGVDFVEETLEIARRIAARLPQVSYREGDLTQLPFADNEFDLVACINVIHHVHDSDQERALAELARIGSGPLVLEIKSYDSFYYRHVHAKTFGGIVVYPTTAARVATCLAEHGYRLTSRKGIFGLSWLSPLDVLVFEPV
jgi:ubiquinone/menaquinone biosynthesis C-methylase UbiE